MGVRPVLVAAALAAGVLVVVLVHGGQHHPSQPRPAGQGAVSVQPPPGPAPTPASSQPAAGSSPTAGDDRPTDGQLQADLDKATGGLPPAAAAALTRLGVAVVRADLTGVGRAQFPGYWPPTAGQATAGPQLDVMTVDAAGARALARDGTRVQVTVIWSGLNPAGLRLARQHSTVELDWDLTTSKWLPRPPTSG